MQKVTLKGHVDANGNLKLEPLLSMKSVDVLVTIAVESQEKVDTVGEGEEDKLLFAGKTAQEILESGLIGICAGSDSWGGGDSASWVDEERRAAGERNKW